MAACQHSDVNSNVDLFCNFSITCHLGTVLLVSVDCLREQVIRTCREVLNIVPKVVCRRQSLATNVGLAPTQAPNDEKARQCEDSRGRDVALDFHARARVFELRAIEIGLHSSKVVEWKN